MAKDKKSFLLYCDIINTVSKLSDEQAGKLFKHILRYVNDENPITDDFIIELAFEPIKTALKRDLIKYEQILEKKRKAGLASANKRQQNQQKTTPVDTCKHNSTHSTDNDIVIDSDIVINNDNDIKKKNKKEKNYPSISDCENYFIDNGFNKELGKKFFEYYDCNDWKDSKGKKVIGWKQKAQFWFNNNQDQQINTQINSNDLSYKAFQIEFNAFRASNPSDDEYKKKCKELELKYKDALAEHRKQTKQ